MFGTVKVSFEEFEKVRQEAKRQCIRYKEEKVGRKKIIHGYNKEGKEIYTKTVEKFFFWKKVEEDISYTI